MATRKKRRKSTPGETNARRPLSESSSLSTLSSLSSLADEPEKASEATNNPGIQSTSGVVATGATRPLATNRHDAPPGRTVFENGRSDRAAPESAMDVQLTISSHAQPAQKPAPRRSRRRSDSAQDLGRDKQSFIWTKGFDPSSAISGNKLIKDARDLHRSKPDQYGRPLSPPRRFTSPASLHAREWRFVHYDSMGDLHDDPNDADLEGAMAQAQHVMPYLSDDMVSPEDVSSSLRSVSADTAWTSSTMLESQNVLFGASSQDRHSFDSANHLRHDSQVSQRWDLSGRGATQQSVARYLDLPGAYDRPTRVDTFTESASAFDNHLNPRFHFQSLLTDDQPLDPFTPASDRPGNALDGTIHTHHRSHDHTADPRQITSNPGQASDAEVNRLTVLPSQDVISAQQPSNEIYLNVRQSLPAISLQLGYEPRLSGPPGHMSAHYFDEARLRQQQMFQQQRPVFRSAYGPPHPPPPGPPLPGPPLPGVPLQDTGMRALRPEGHQQPDDNSSANYRPATRGMDHGSENLYGTDSKFDWKKHLRSRPQPSRAQPSREHLPMERVKDLDANSVAQLRSSRASRLAARSHQDTDVLSGYPARQWLKETSNVSLVPPKVPQSTETKSQSVWTAPPMPRGSELYPEFSQRLLSRMRAPQVPEEDKETPDEGEEDAMGEEDHAVKIPKYNLIPLGRETPGRRFLADRRKGLPSLYEGSGTVQAKRSAKVRQTLADGSEHIIEVLVPEGQTMPGEVSEAVAPAVSAELLPAGTIVEGVGIANSEGVVVAASEATTPQSNRRKPPAPKRKKTHPMKGKKKKVMLEVPNAEGGVDMVESGTPRPDEDDEGDEDEGDDGEATGDATPTPVSGGTPAAIPEPPRSVPADAVPLVRVESESTHAQAEQIDDKMEVDAVAVAAAQEQDRPPAAQTVTPPSPTPSVPSGTVDDQVPESAAASGSGALDSAPQAAKVTPTDVSKAPQDDDPGVSREQEQDQASTPHTSADADSLSKTGEGPTSLLMSQPPIESSAVPAAASASVVEPLQPVEPPIETLVGPQTAPAEESIVTATAEIPSVADSTIAEAVVQDALPEAPEPEDIATRSPAAEEPALTETTAAQDAVPEALKPEEIATSNQAVPQSEAPHDESEQKEAGTDILGSLEQSLG